MCHRCCLVRLVNIASCTSLFAMELEKVLVNGKIYRFLSKRCPISIISNVTNNKTELLKTVRLTSFQKLLSNLLQVCPSVPPVVLAVLVIPSFHVLRSYFCFTQFGDRSFILNFEKLLDTAPLALNQFLYFDSKLHSNLLTAFFSTRRSVLTSTAAAYSVAKVATVERLRSEKLTGPFRNGY